LSLFEIEIRENKANIEAIRYIGKSGIAEGSIGA
jgi:hypothetical protein